MRFYKIVKVEFDTDGKKGLAKELSDQYVGKLFYVSDDELDEDEAQNEAMEAVSEHSGWCIKSIEFLLLERRNFVG